MEWRGKRTVTYHHIVNRPLVFSLIIENIFFYQNSLKVPSQDKADTEEHGIKVSLF